MQKDMKKRQDKDVFEMYGLDKNDPFIAGYVERLSSAVTKLYDIFKENGESSSVFNEFVYAREFYEYMPESSKSECSEILELSEKMWEDVAKSKADFFCELCAKCQEEDYKTLCESSLDILEAICALDGKILEAQRIFEAAHNAVKHGNSLPEICIAHLYVLCARIWYRCLGYPCDGEELMLSEGIKHHMKAKEQGTTPKTELYSLHIATAIFDVCYVRLGKGIKKEEISNLINEAYSLLSPIDSPAAIKEKVDLYQLTGIPYPNMENEDNIWMTRQSSDDNKKLLN